MRGILIAMDDVDGGFQSAELDRIGIDRADQITVTGHWPCTITILRLGSNTFLREPSPVFDVFLATRALTLNELIGDKGRRRFHYRSGVVGFTPPGQSWAVAWEGIMEGVSILFDPETMERAAHGFFRAPPQPGQWRMALGDHSPAIAFLGLDIASQAVSGYPAGKDHFDMVLGSFLSLIVRRYRTDTLHEDLKSGIVNRRVLLAMALIDRELRNPSLSVEIIARDAAASPSQLNRLFRAETGLSTWSYVLERRLAKARRLIEETDLTNPVIAIQCGFSSLPAFTAMFQKHVGVTPTTYREVHSSIRT
jgi:AraC family transcriptional regulator